MIRYRFLTTWLIEADREAVFDALLEGEDWPTWWPGCERTTRLAEGDERGIGRRGRYEWRSSTGYRVGFVITATAIERPRLLEGQAEGDLIGTGCWHIFAEGDLTAVAYEWDVYPGKRWMRLLGPVVRPLLRRNHDALMEAGARGLCDHLGGRLIAASSAPVGRGR